MSDYKDPTDTSAPEADTDFIELPPPTHERETRMIRSAVGDLATSIADIQARTVQTQQMIADLTSRVENLHAKVDSLTAMTARAPSGRTLINLVEEINSKVQD